jgi:hypothetical protein
MKLEIRKHLPGSPVPSLRTHFLQIMHKVTAYYTDSRINYNTCKHVKSSRLNLFYFISGNNKNRIRNFCKKNSISTKDVHFSSYIWEITSREALRERHVARKGTVRSVPQIFNRINRARDATLDISALTEGIGPFRF